MVGKAESGKDVIQTLAESGAEKVSRITGIITKAVVDVSRELGDLATDAFEMRDAAKKATEDEPDQ